MTYPKIARLSSMILLILCCMACQKDDNSLRTTPSTTDVETILKPYFERFVAEGKQRGLNIDISEITGHIAEIHEENVAGQCTYSSAHPNRVTIDQSFWNSANEAYREMVVFHELGHCALLRGHRDDSSPNGICQSIMNSGLSNCRLLYNTTNRSAYLDELFRQQ